MVVHLLWPLISLYHLIITLCFVFVFFFNDTATTEIYTLSLHDALPIPMVLRGGFVLLIVCHCVGDMKDVMSRAESSVVSGLISLHCSCIDRIALCAWLTVHLGCA